MLLVDRAPRTAPPASARAVRTGVFVLVVLTAGAYLPSPMLPGYQAEFGAGDLAMTLVYATFALVSAPSLVLFGPASDVLGPRAALRAGVLAAAVGSACFALASGTEWLLLGRAAQGVALGAATGAASTLISAGQPGRGPVLASAAFLAGTAIGPVAGGIFAEYVPAAGVLANALHLVLLGVAWRWVSALGSGRRGAALGQAGRRSARWRPAAPRIPGGMRWSFLSSAGTGFVAWTVAGLFLALIPALLQRGAGANPAVSGCVLGAVLICSVVVQPLVPRWGPRRGQLAGLGALLGALVVLAATAGGSLVVTLGAAVIAGFGHGLAYGGATAAVDREVPAGERGGVLSALYLAFYLGAGCPAVVVGLLTSRFPLAAATSGVAWAAACLVPVVAAAVVRAGAGAPARAR